MKTLFAIITSIIVAFGGTAEKEATVTEVPVTVIEETKNTSREVEIKLPTVKEEPKIIEEIPVTKSIPSELSHIKKEDIVLELKKNWDYLTDAERRQFLMRFVKKIAVASERAQNGRYWIVTVTDVEVV